MAKYSKFRGKSIVSKDEDFSTAYGASGSSFEGHLYYNTADGQIKYLSGAGAGAWASGGNLNSARFLQGGAGAANTAALTFGGRNPDLSPGPNVALTESYDGSSWTEVGDLNNATS